MTLIPNLDMQKRKNIIQLYFATPYVYHVCLSQKDITTSLCEFPHPLFREFISKVQFKVGVFFISDLHQRAFADDNKDSILWTLSVNVVRGWMSK